VIVTMDRPEAQNALTYEMLTTLAHTFRNLRDDKTVRAVVLTGAGVQSFSAGVDLAAAQKVFKTDEKDFDKDVVHQMDLCTFPIIGAINGWAINAGFELALACDMLFASPAATFMDTHIKFGLQPAWGLSQRLPRMIGANRAKEVSFVGAPLGAETACQWGLVNRVVKAEELMSVATKTAERIAAFRPEMVQAFKRVLNDGMALALGEARTMERARAFAHYRAMPASDFDKMRKFIAAGKKGSSAAIKPQTVSKL